MSQLRIPHGVTNWRTSATIWTMLVLGQSLPLFLGLQAGALDWEPTTEATGLVTAAVVLGAGLLLHVHWRLTGWRSSGVLSGGVVALALFLTMATLLLLAAPGGHTGVAPWLVGEQTALVCAAALLLYARRRPLRSMQPTKAGVLLGLAAAGLALLVSLAPPVAPSPSGQVMLVLALVTAYGLLSTGLLDELGALPWVRTRLAAAALLLGLGQAALNLPQGLGLTVVLLVANGAGTALLVTTALAMVTGALADNRRAVERLEERLQRAERGTHAQRATLHEIRATMGGIASASRLIHEGQLAPDRRDSLAAMVDSELGRLERLMDDRVTRGADEVDVDAALEPLVLRQRVRGQEVLWSRTGLRMLTRGDDLAEIVNILLENSRRHAPGATTSVEVEAADGPGVRIRVSDTGPGVASAVRHRIFEWGARGAASPGQGIGLPVARELARDLGGDVVLDDSLGGASFVATVPSRPLLGTVDVAATGDAPTREEADRVGLSVSPS